MKNYRRVIGYLITLLILFFLARTLYSSWSQVVESGFQFNFNAPLLIVSLVLLVVGRGFAVEAWRRILIALGDYISFTVAMRVWFISNLARYIPGNVWQVAAMVSMVEEKGVSKTNALISQIIYTAIALAVAGLMGLGFIFVRADIVNGIVDVARVPYVQYAPWLGGAAFIALIGILSAPHSYRFIVSIAARITHRELIAPDHSFARGLVPPLFSIAMWLTNGIAFYIFAASIVPVPLSRLAAFIAMNAAAYWIGYVSFITPSGLGFREAALALMLAVFFPTPVAIALSLVTRLWSTVGELLGVLTIWGVPSRKMFAREDRAR